MTQNTINAYTNYNDNRDVISLFSGAMGLDIGLGKAGLNVVIGQDFEPACVETMKANGHNVLGGDIREIDPQVLLDMTGLKVGEPFLICGGPPCQPFSTAGKRLGINDPRGSLFMDFIRMIDYIKPRFFVMENVKGIMSAPLKHVPTAERDDTDPDQKLGTVLDVILSEFNKLGYKTVYGVLDAVNYGVPQFRERFVLIGSRDNEEIFLPIANALDIFYSTLIDKIDGLDIKKVMKRKNPYLYRAKAMQSASEIVESVLNAFVTSSEETIFGNCFFEPIAIAASGGNKALSEGIDSWWAFIGHRIQ